MRMDVYEIENEQMTGISNRTRSQLSNINKVNNPLARLIKH
jgi:hypothetical protein